MTLNRKLILLLAIASSVSSLPNYAEANNNTLKTETSFSVKNFWKQQTVTDSLPLDPKVKVATLPNGFTYYIVQNSEPKDRVIMYLANKVGSILETDSQQGLAHFLEHMNFNGTTHFPKNELVDYLQKAGVRFGADLNAYTSFTETIYQLPIPSNQPELLENGLLIMRDWANGALLEAKEIDQERGVILEEKRQRGGLSARIQEQTFPLVTNNSLYAKRMPIGTEEILKNFDYEEIRSFHRNWYRPELQALIVVGDIDPQEIEKRIVAHFSPLENPKNAPKHFVPKIELNGENHFLGFSDKEVTSTSLQIMYKKPEFNIVKAGDYRTSLTKSLYAQLVNTRLRELLRESATPFLSANIGSVAMLGGLESNSIQIGPKPGKLQESIALVYGVLKQVEEFGFTEAEINRAKESYKTMLARNAAEIDKTPSKSYVEELLNHFLKGTPSPSFDYVYPILTKNIEEIQSADLIAHSSDFFQEGNRDIVLVTGQDSEDAASESDILAWIETASKQEVTSYTEEAVDDKLIKELPAPGSITKREENTKIGTKTWTLSNGAKVIVKPTDFKNDEIQFTSYSPGGFSLYDKSDYQSATNAVSIVTSSGLGNFNSLQLGRYLNGKSVSVAPFINEIGEGIRGSANKESLETAFQLIHAYFYQSRLDKDINKASIERSKISLANRLNNPSAIFSDSISHILYRGDERRTGATIEKLEQVNLDRAWEIYKDRFADASDFTFVFVGNFDEKVLESYLEQYIATLPNLGRKENFRDAGPHPLKKGISVDIRKGSEEKSTVAMAYLGDYKYEEHDNLLMQALSACIDIKLIERLREKEGGVYSINVSPSLIQNPKNRFALNISFTTDPQLVDKLTNAAKEEIKLIKKNGPSEAGVEKFIAERLLSSKQNLRNNGFWLSYLLSSSIDGLDADRVLTSDERLKTITAKDIQRIANKYLKDKNLFQFVHYPETAK